DPARLMAGKDATNAEVEALRASLGLDGPLLKRYFAFMTDLFKCDLGYSLRSNASGTKLFGDMVLHSLPLLVLSIWWAFAFGVLLGIVAAVFRGRLPDYLGTVTAISGISVPNFWLGLVMIQLFAVVFNIFPAGGIETWKGYILPSIAL